MTNYDFKLGEKAKNAPKKQIEAQSANIIEGTDNFVNRILVTFLTL